MKQKIGARALAKDAMPKTKQGTGFAHARPFEHAPMGRGRRRRPVRMPCPNNLAKDAMHLAGVAA